MFDFGFSSYCLTKSVFLFVLVFLCLCERLCECFFCLRGKEEAVSGAIEEAYHLRKRDG